MYMYVEEINEKYSTTVCGGNIGNGMSCLYVSLLKNEHTRHEHVYNNINDDNNRLFLLLLLYRIVKG